jgi:hypothetical protein
MTSLMSSFVWLLCLTSNTVTLAKECKLRSLANNGERYGACAGTDLNAAYPTHGLS